MRVAVAVALLFLPRIADAQASCQPVGVWELVSGKTDTVPYPATLHSRKVITKTHFAFVTRDDSAIKPLRTTADSLAFLQSMAAGSGTYTLRGTTYTERPDFYPDPAYVGMDLAFTCRTEGDRLYQKGSVPVLQNGAKVGDVKLEEVWRRVE
ncbi:MAG TPA: hypothetical protein VM716_00960 [Gemmatimonadales bacterium]|nr:hypothetical protein [Gemmatimonadales bacterium]